MAECRSIARSCARLLGQATLTFAATCANAENFANARYIEPVERYGHFAPGRPHEYAGLTATTGTGKAVTLRLNDDEVFEDVAPRVVKLRANEPDQLLVIISNRKNGSRLALVQHIGESLRIVAQSDPIGIPMRWLNPVAVSDLDGDGQAEIAAVVTPHIGGILKIYRRAGDRLVASASLDGFSNHTYGSPEQALSIAVTLDGQPRLLVPDTSKNRLRLIALKDGQLVETASCPLADQLTGPVRLQTRNIVWAFAAAGPQTVDLSACPRMPP